MLISLSIRNYALIEKLNIDFSSGFSIITGETGAGKSILLGALGLVLGKRADLSSLKNKEEKCVIEAQFDITHYPLQQFFQENDLDFEKCTIIRREILPSGKSRAFVNDTPVNLQELIELGDQLLDIHSQNQTQSLTETDFQFQIVDAIAQNENLLQSYSNQLKEYKSVQNQLAQKEKELKELSLEEDYIQFLYQELEQAHLIEGEQEELESVFEKGQNTELIKEQLAKSIQLTDNEQFGVLSQLKEIKISLQKISSIASEYQLVFDRIESLHIELKDILSELNQLSENVYFDPEELERVNQKLQLLYALQKKHQVNSVSELVQIKDSLQSKVSSFSELENEIQDLKETKVQLEKELKQLASKMHSNRETAIPKLIHQLKSKLVLLGMPDVQFKIELDFTPNFYTNGFDTLQFLVAVNKGSDFGPIKKVASGGELSRIMLVVKAILADYSTLPTLLFDEIDTGVSGEIADKMGEIMKAMSQNRQIFAITHLPQIAAKGQTHYKVFKVTNAYQTESNISKLNQEERVLEIAQMLSGAKVSESALLHAKDLLN